MSRAEELAMNKEELMKSEDGGEGGGSLVARNMNLLIYCNKTNLKILVH